MLQIHPATPSDNSRLTTLFLAAFSDSFNLSLFPRTPDVRAWWEEKFAREATAPGQVLLKVVDTPDHAGGAGGQGEGDGEIAAFALWKLPKQEKNGKQDDDKEEREEEEEEEEWPQSSNSDLCQRFFGGMAARRAEYMGSKPHYCTSFPTFPSMRCIQSRSCIHSCIHACMTFVANACRPRHARHTPALQWPRDSFNATEMGS